MTKLQLNKLEIGALVLAPKFVGVQGRHKMGIYSLNELVPVLVLNINMKYNTLKILDGSEVRYATATTLRLIEACK